MITSGVHVDSWFSDELQSWSVDVRGSCGTVVCTLVEQSVMTSLDYAVAIESKYSC